ncbi:hypothetical protein HPB50_005916 [Hyalomma asiaticum]|uniref:Uncharacterized protein n=1 Tax=Hyalomma asiaticum TaxID=266040 RepID=A0ACB7SLE5_HYAAI|nr:hypothetical protein HPB50_005916 [Hyalomma asiaticum]
MITLVEKKVLNNRRLKQKEIAARIVPFGTTLFRIIRHIYLIKVSASLLEYNMTSGMNALFACIVVATLALEATAGGYGGGSGWNTGGHGYNYGGDRSSEESHERYHGHGYQSHGHYQQPIYGGHPTYIQRPVHHSGYAPTYGSQHGHSSLLHKLTDKFHG